MASHNVSNKKTMEGISDKKKPPYVMKRGHTAHKVAVIAAAGGDVNRRATRHARSGTTADSRNHSTDATHRPRRPCPKIDNGKASKR